MTPKKEAKELIDEYLKLFNWDQVKAHKAKQCALITVNKMIEAIPVLAIDSGANNNAIDYYKQMKQEIEKS